MEAVQQKVALSQQLEKWEVDMQVMLQEQVKDKLVGNSSGQSGKSSSSDTDKDIKTKFNHVILLKILHYLPKQFIKETNL